jgi:hypothetical protein
MEQVQRLADARPKGSSAVNLTAPQWQEPSTVTGSAEPVSMVKAFSKRKTRPSNEPVSLNDQNP